MTRHSSLVPPSLKGSPGGATWPAALDLRFAHNHAGTHLAHSVHHGPLYVQKAFYPEGPECAHVYLLHPPGGIVSGDSLETDLTLEPGAHVLLTTPGAQRLYRARQDGPGRKPLVQRVESRIQVREGATAEWLPGETIVFDGAEISLLTRVDIPGNGRFCGWEISCLGLPAGDQLFRSGSFQQTFAIYQGGRPRVIDRLSFGAASALRQAHCGLRSKPVLGTLVFGPLGQLTPVTCIDEFVDRVRAELARFVACRGYEDDDYAVTVVGDFLILRYLGSSSERARNLFVCAWEIMRPLGLGRVAVRPRIWAT